MKSAQTFFDNLKALEKDGQLFLREIMQECLDAETGAGYSALLAHLRAMEAVSKARVETQSTLYQLGEIKEEMKMIKRVETQEQGMEE